MLLVTLGVTSLYTNIPYDEGINARKMALDSRTVQQPPTEDLTQLMNLILAKNNFTFNGKHFLQIYGLVWKYEWAHHTCMQTSL